MIDDLIALDGRGRTVPTERAALAEAVERLSAEPDGDPRRLRRIGIGLLAPGAHRRAEQALDRALGPAPAGGDARAVVAVSINLGDVHRYRGRPDEAEPHCLRALDTARTSAPGPVDFALQHLGEHHHEQGRRGEACAAWRKP
ncbi:tetratricopeptide repeat protein [Kitasatospora sp. KL5]|uniref:tetratricopeptide repeat protein n=1 Tax=Kitasatospora sp. KL5 TaxID=3425125 RepID=UPI003D6F6412